MATQNPKIAALLAAAKMKQLAATPTPKTASAESSAATAEAEPVAVQAQLPSPVAHLQVSTEPQSEQHRQVLESLENLKTLLIAKDPQFPHLLSHIHKQLFDSPELSHILTDEEIGIVVQGWLEKNKVQIQVKASKATSPKGGKKSLKGLLDDGTKPGDWL